MELGTYYPRSVRMPLSLASVLGVERMSSAVRFDLPGGKKCQPMQASGRRKVIRDSDVQSPSPPPKATSQPAPNIGVPSNQISLLDERSCPRNRHVGEGEEYRNHARCSIWRPKVRKARAATSCMGNISRSRGGNVTLGYRSTTPDQGSIRQSEPSGGTL